MTLTFEQYEVVLVLEMKARASGVVLISFVTEMVYSKLEEQYIDFSFFIGLFFR